MMTIMYGNDNKSEGERDEESKGLLDANAEEDDSSLKGDDWNNEENNVSMKKMSNYKDDDGTLENGIEEKEEKNKKTSKSISMYDYNDDLLKTKSYHYLYPMTREKLSSLDRNDIALAGSWLLTLILIVLLCKQNNDNNGSSTNVSTTSSIDIPTKNDTDAIGTNASYTYTRPNKIFGYIHIAKTAGTEINGELANHFERICGNKGFSYDAIQHNKRANGKVDGVSDSMHQLDKKMNRGHVPPGIMAEIGFEDCDWIAEENWWGFWKRFENWSIPMEIHVPCRLPILDHLMSQCNFKYKIFDCEVDDLRAEIMKCDTGTQTRFQMQLAKIIPTKCFNPMPIDNYIRYMSTKLQRRSIESEYIHRDTNQPRNKTAECVWTKGHDFQHKLKAILMEKMDYFRFCEQCIGSKNELKLV